jgi:hypothetical protein
MRIAVLMLTTAGLLSTPAAAQESCPVRAKHTARLVADLNADATGATATEGLVLGEARLARWRPR